MTSLHWQTSLQNRQCHALCTLGRTSKCDRVLRPICLWSLHKRSQSFTQLCLDVYEDITRMSNAEVVALHSSQFDMGLWEGTFTLPSVRLVFTLCVHASNKHGSISALAWYIWLWQQTKCLFMGWTIDAWMRVSFNVSVNYVVVWRHCPSSS